MKNTLFKGMATAMVTPMTPHGVDYDTLARFIDFQLESGINALVAVGTTGESATLTPSSRHLSSTSLSSAGVSVESHNTALAAMRAVQIEILQ